MSAYSNYDPDGFPLIPNTDMYVSQECKSMGLAALIEANAELSNLAFNDSSVDTNLVAQDINILLYEKQHVNCLGSCTKDPCSYFHR